MESISAYLDGAEKNFWCVRDTQTEALEELAAILGLFIALGITAAQWEEVKQTAELIR
jgi:hypothetical protein